MDAAQHARATCAADLQARDAELSKLRVELTDAYVRTTSRFSEPVDYRERSVGVRCVQ